MLTDAVRSCALFHRRLYCICRCPPPCPPSPPKRGPCPEPEAWNKGKLCVPQGAAPCMPQGPNICLPPVQPHSSGSYKKFERIFYFVMIPLIIIQMIKVFSNHEEVAVEPCFDYEYMRVRNRKYPWGDGVKTLFHNPELNKLPGECQGEPVVDNSCDD